MTPQTPQSPDAVTIGIFIGVVSGLIVGAITGAWRRLLTLPGRAWAFLFMRPRLRLEPREGIEVISVPDPTTPGSRIGVRCNFAWIKVHNDADRPQSDARDAQARLAFHDAATGQRLIEFRGRWRNSPQGADVAGNTEGIIDRIVVRAGDDEELDVAFRFEREGHAYALNTESHRYPLWRRPEWRLPPGKYRVKARVSARNARSVSAEFDLDVHANTLSFRKR